MIAKHVSVDAKRIGPKPVGARGIKQTAGYRQNECDDVHLKDPFAGIVLHRIKRGITESFRL
jgi:hypothetical protein